jgi:hypothetical protein
MEFFFSDHCMDTGSAALGTVNDDSESESDSALACCLYRSQSERSLGPGTDSGKPFYNGRRLVTWNHPSRTWRDCSKPAAGPTRLNSQVSRMVNALVPQLIMRYSELVNVNQLEHGE